MTKKKVNQELLNSPYLSEWGRSIISSLEIDEDAQKFLELAKKLKINTDEQKVLAQRVDELIKNEQVSILVTELFVNYFNEKIRLNCSDLGSEEKEFTNTKNTTNKKPMFRRGE